MSLWEFHMTLVWTAPRGGSVCHVVMERPTHLGSDNKQLGGNGKGTQKKKQSFRLQFSVRQFEKTKARGAACQTCRTATQPEKFKGFVQAARCGMTSANLMSGDKESKKVSNSMKRDRDYHRKPWMIAKVTISIWIIKKKAFYHAAPFSKHTAGNISAPVFILITLCPTQDFLLLHSYFLFFSFLVFNWLKPPPLSSSSSPVPSGSIKHLKDQVKSTSTWAAPSDGGRGFLPRPVEQRVHLHLLPITTCSSCVFLLTHQIGSSSIRLALCLHVLFHPDGIACTLQAADVTWWCHVSLSVIITCRLCVCVSHYSLLQNSTSPIYCQKTREIASVLKDYSSLFSQVFCLISHSRCDAVLRYPPCVWTIRWHLLWSPCQISVVR